MSDVNRLTALDIARTEAANGGGRARLGLTRDQPPYSVANAQQSRSPVFSVVASHMQVFVGSTAIRELMRQARVSAVVAGTGSPPRLEAHDRTLQVSPSVHGSSNLPVRPAGERRPLYTVNAHSPATTACLTSQRVNSSAVLVFSPARDFEMSRLSAATPQHTSALCDDADQHEG